MLLSLGANIHAKDGKNRSGRHAELCVHTLCQEPLKQPVLHLLLQGAARCMDAKGSWSSTAYEPCSFL